MTSLRSFRELPVLVVVGLVGLVVLYAMTSLVIPIGAGLEGTGQTWSEFLHGEFAAWMHAALAEIPRVFTPSRFLSLMGGKVLLPAGAALLVFFFWRRSIGPSLSRKESFFLQTLALAPVCVGMFWTIHDLQSSFAALAEAGLSSPELVGIGIAESTVGTVVGCLLALALLVVFRALKHLQGSAGKSTET